MIVKTPVTARIFFFTFIMTCCAISPAFGQNARLQIDYLDRLFPNAVQTVDVSVDSSLLLIAAKFLRSDNADEALAKELISALKGVYVKGVEFEKEGEFSEADIEMIRTQLRAPGWDRIVGVRSKRERENVEVYLMIEGSVITGVSVLVFDPKQFYVVNVVGPIDPEKISQLRGHFGIPRNLDFDWSKVERKRGRI
ncbi:MAG: DUF4252 domain-containing protein [Acidobacteria bacterium]|nr:DUF4252 domain-containing protein [Acidobacteriota bacterium]